MVPPFLRWGRGSREPREHGAAVGCLPHHGGTASGIYAQCTRAAIAGIIDFWGWSPCILAKWRSGAGLNEDRRLLSWVLPILA